MKHSIYYYVVIIMCVCCVCVCVCVCCVCVRACVCACALACACVCNGKLLLHVELNITWEDHSARFNKAIGEITCVESFPFCPY